MENGIILPHLSQLNHAYWYRFIVEEEDSQLELRYKCHLRFIKWKSQSSALLCVERHPDVYINNEFPDLALDQLAYETGRVFYPMIIEIDKQSRWMGIRNKDQIQERWLKIRTKATQLFTGEEAIRYMERMDDMIASPTALDEVFRDDLFIRFYFNTVYSDHASARETGKQIIFPVGDYAPISFEVHQVEKESDRPESREIQQRGTAPKGQTYSADFLLETGSNCIREAVAEWNFVFPFPKKIRVILFKLREQPAKSWDLELEEKEDVGNKKGFFSQFFGG